MTSTFRELIISRPALLTELGGSLLELAQRTGMRIVAVNNDDDVSAQQPTSRSTTLLARGKPHAGWIAKAEHGNLYVRPNEYYINAIMGCVASCTYCYLNALPQGRLPLTVHTDYLDLCKELRETCSDIPIDRLYCTGELSDSLGDSNIIPIAQKLTELFGSEELGTLELRTKFERLDVLKNLRHSGRTTIAISLAPENYVSKYERRTASAHQRIHFAAAAASLGYPIALKFEPLLLEDNWQVEYSKLVSAVGNILDPNLIAHISVGSLRWSDELRNYPLFRAAHSNEIRLGEEISYRQTRSNWAPECHRRIDAYRWFRRLLRSVGVSAPIYWSLETASVCQEMAKDV